MQVPEVSDGGLVEVRVRGVGGKPSNKKRKQIKLAFYKTNAITHIQRPLYLDSLELVQQHVNEYKQHQYHQQRPPPKHQNTCRAPGSPVPGHLAHHLAETSVRQLVPNLGHELTTISWFDD